MSTTIQTGCAAVPQPKVKETLSWKEWSKDLSHSIRQLWDQTIPYTIPTVSAGLAIIPVYYGFAAKSELQLGKQMPKMRIREAISGGLGLSPIIGSVVGSQIALQKLIEMGLSYWMPDRKNDDPKLMIASSVAVGVISSPLLAALNGKTLKQTVSQSIKNLNRWQIGAIVGRETSFLLSLRISDPLGGYMKQNFGDKPLVEYGSAFASGAIGSLVGHPADTALTLWQQKMRVNSCTSLLKGSFCKAVTVGLFTAGYRASKNGLNCMNRAIMS